MEVSLFDAENLDVKIQSKRLHSEHHWWISTAEGSPQTIGGMFAQKYKWLTMVASKEGEWIVRLSKDHPLDAAAEFSLLTANVCQEEQMDAMDAIYYLCALNSTQSLEEMPSYEQFTSNFTDHLRQNRLAKAKDTQRQDETPMPTDPMAADLNMYQ